LDININVPKAEKISYFYPERWKYRARIYASIFPFQNEHIKHRALMYIREFWFM